MANDYISREAAYDTLTDYYHHRTDIQHQTLREALSRVPAADVRPVVRGTWEYISFMTCRCSVCKEVFHELDGDNFCPNCGASMREVKIDG